jgi:hypothetical protein
MRRQPPGDCRAGRRNGRGARSPSAPATARRGPEGRRDYLPAPAFGTEPSVVMRIWISSLTYGT